MEGQNLPAAPQRGSFAMDGSSEGGAQVGLFAPFRALGYVSGRTAISVHRKGTASFITTAVGRSWQLFNANKLILLFVGPQYPKRVCALAAKGDLTFAAAGKNIHVSRRAKEEGVWEGHTAPVVQLMDFGPNLLSLSQDKTVKVWEMGNYDGPVQEIVLEPGLTPTVLVHPPTYLNKVLIGTAEGALQLWNISTGTLIHTFKGWGAGVCCMAATPALDVVAVGLMDGRVVLHNLRYDQPVTSFVHDAAGGAVTALSLMDAPNHKPLLAVGGTTGVITLWDLGKRKLYAVIKDAHVGAITALHFLASEPVLVSAAVDNSLKEWVLEEAEGAPRLLRERCGHAAPPTILHHYGSSGRHLLSAGQDLSFRAFSTIQDQQSKELSQGHIKKKARKMKLAEQELKLPRVLAVASCETREHDWCNVVTAHEADASAYVWHLAKGALGKHILTPPDSPGAVTAVCISPCGNTALVATEAGTIDAFNMQSGLHRGTFRRTAEDVEAEGTDGVALSVKRPAPPLSSTRALMASLERNGAEVAEAGRPAHQGAVTGVAIDGCNRAAVSAGYDGRIRLWHYKQRRLRKDITVGGAVTHMHMHSGTSLLAVATDTLEVLVFDPEQGARVRRFRGHTDRVTALQWSADARWVLSASLDGTVRVWDVPAAACLQTMRLGPAVTALSLSPTMDLLATAHVNHVGIYLWANRPLYLGTNALHGSGSLGGSGAADGARGGSAAAAATAEAVDIRLPTVSDAVAKNPQDVAAAPPDAAAVAGGAAAGGGEVEEDADFARVVSEVAAAETATDARGALPLVAGSLTLSRLPRSQWKSLINLETIKERNKPVAPPKKPEAAPFFLPTVANAAGTTTFDLSAMPAEGESKLLRRGGGTAAALSEFVARLKKGAVAGDYALVTEHLRSLGPSAIDTEIRSIGLASPDAANLTAEDAELMAAVLDFVAAETRERRNFEFLQSFLHLFLQVHGEALAANAPLREQAAAMDAELGCAWGGIDSMLQDVRCMYSFFSGHAN